MNDTKQFISDMEEAGHEVRAYGGRFYWRGPGVWYDGQRELMEIIRATTVDLQWDSPVIYPIHNDPAWYEAHKNDPYGEEDEE
jgi:hypothetical protein